MVAMKTLGESGLQSSDIAEFTKRVKTVEESTDRVWSMLFLGNVQWRLDGHSPWCDSPAECEHG